MIFTADPDQKKAVEKPVTPGSAIYSEPLYYYAVFNSSTSR